MPTKVPGTLYYLSLVTTSQPDTVIFPACALLCSHFIKAIEMKELS